MRRDNKIKFKTFSAVPARIGVIGKVLATQVFVTVAAVLGLLVFQDAHAAIAAAIGGVIGFAGGGVYARKMQVASATPEEMLAGHYRAEGYKFVTAAVLFAMTFMLYREIAPIPLFLTYAATLLVYWAALLFF